MKPLAAFALLLLASLCVRAASPQPLRVSGYCYSPFRDGQSPALGIYPTRSEIKADLGLLRGSSRMIRTYGMSGIQEKIPTIAKALGIKCYAGAWIDTDVSANATELAALKRLAARRIPAGVIVGNEVLLRKSRTPAELVALIQDVKSVSKVPVGYAETWAEWLAHPEVAAECDFLMVHVHPYWEQIAPESAADYVFQRLDQVADADPGKQVFLGETGWPSDGPALGAAVPSEENQRVFIEGFVRRAAAECTGYFLFSAFDEKWKAENTGLEVEAHWGAFGSNRVLKPALQSFFATPPPLITIKRLPPAGSGARSRGSVRGYVCGIAPEERKAQRVVIYARTDRWYLQPSIASPFTAIRRNGTWLTRTHLGDEYLALLVRSTFQPPVIMDAIPVVGGDVLAVSQCLAAE